MSDETESQDEAGALVDAQEALDADAVLATPAGRRWVWKLLEERCGLHAASSIGDPLQMAARAGARNVGVLLMLDLQRRNLQGYLAMVREQLDAIIENEVKRG